MSMNAGQDTWARIVKSVKDVFPGTARTCIWMIKITVGVSFAMMLLKFFNILPWISDFINPCFKHFGLPGSAALAYLSGYFVNTYSAAAVITSLNLDWRATTIIATMVLCSHSMVLETAVLKKTGTSATRMVLIRTLTALALGFILNLTLPGSGAQFTDTMGHKWTTPLGQTLLDWTLSTLKLVVIMATVISALNILQRILSEFGIMDLIARLFKPLMYVLGLPPNTAFLWLVANIVGLGYGAAVMFDEIERGMLSKHDVDLLDTHISINHSNVEDLTILTAMGGSWWIMLTVRLIAATILVWTTRLMSLVRNDQHIQIYSK